MTGGHSPFDIDPREKQARMARSIGYEIIAGIVLVLVVGGALYAIHRYERGRIVAGPLIQARADGTLLVAWRTGGATDTELVLGLAPTPGEEGTSGTVIRPTVADGHFVALLPQTLINYPYSAYTIRSNLGLFYRSEGPWSIALPRAETPYRFVAFGASAGSSRPRAMATAILQTYPHMVLHIGDLVYQAGEWAGSYEGQYEDQFLDPYSILVNTMPFMPVISGHEKSIAAGEPFRRFFVLPRNGPAGLVPELTYWFDYGTARYVAIDTNQSAEIIEQKIVPWLAEVLGSTRTTWRFVFMHHSAYTGGRQNPPDEKVQRILVPHFEALGVDMIFSAGNYLYERTVPLRAGEPVEQGIVYITTGAGGRGLQPQQKPSPSFIAAFNDQVRSFTLVELVGRRLHLRQVSETGQVLDESWLNK